ncbi:Ycf3-interacting protein 1 [Scenedesmus sp. PABB004]|nr:Ycf3-interacting protein 1 [Scenedesmus sp. PABB004]
MLAQQRGALAPRAPARRARAGAAALARPGARPSPLRRLQRRAAAEETGAVPAVQLEDQVEAFMKRQAELESGAAFARTKDPAEVIGADVVDEENAKALCREVVRMLRTLKARRDMSVNEARLIVGIEDPRTRERRQLGIEDERGVSRDEMAAALLDVAEGRVPRDRLALKCLVEDMQSWPFLDDDTSAAAAEGSGGPIAVSSSGQPEAIVDDATGIVRPYVMGGDLRKGEQPQGLADMLPDWVGFSTLYGISAIPVLIVTATVLILFYNSLK